MLVRIILAAMLLVSLAFAPVTGPLRLALYLIPYLLVGYDILLKAAKGIRNGRVFDENFLMAVATLGAIAIALYDDTGEYTEAVAVMLFYQIGEWFQAYAVGKSRKNISDLMDIRPDYANIEKSGKIEQVAPESVEVGTVIVVQPGEKVPIDGIVIRGETSLNTSALTGESLPKNITPGENVTSGCINLTGVIYVRTTRLFGDSTVSQILELVENASSRKSQSEAFITRFARIYTPAVTGLAALIVLLPWLWSLGHAQFSFVFNDWLYRALVFLVISCPCALVVSIPLGYFGGIGAASRLGILFKGGNYLDAISQTNTVVFDKTGTLTQGRFEVQACLPAAGISPQRLIQLMASVEQNSTHPLVKAITAYAVQQGIPTLPATEITETSGNGLEASIERCHILVGNERMLIGRGISPTQQISLQTTDATAVHCAAEGKYIGCLLLADTPKDDARQAIEALKTLNINNIQILSGDKQAIVTNFARKLGITQAHGELLPEGKVQHLENLRQDKSNRIVFVGDGINDAPVLALSHVGIAMGGLGSDAAIETADVVIQTDQPSKVATAIRAGRQTRRIVWQNIVLALGVKLLVLLLGAAGMANLWEAVFADVGVALLAVMNAIRVQKLIK